MHPISPREWGRRQAARSPRWSEEKWQRVGEILGVDLSHPKPDKEKHSETDEPRQRRDAA